MTAALALVVLLLAPLGLGADLGVDADLDTSPASLTDVAVSAVDDPLDPLAAVPEASVSIQAPLCDPCSVGTSTDRGLQAQTSLTPATSPTPSQRVAAAAEDAAPAAAGLSIAALLALLAWKLHWFAGLAAWPLFSRIRDDALLKHPVRAAITDHLDGAPGTTMAQLRRRLELSHGTAVHHLRLLEKRGLITSCADGAMRRYWRTGDPESARRREASLLRRPAARRIAAYVQAHPGVHQAAVCDALGLRAPAASKQLTRLEAAGLVQAEKRSRRRHYHPSELLGRLIAGGPGPGPTGGVPA